MAHGSCCFEGGFSVTTGRQSSESGDLHQCGRDLKVQQLVERSEVIVRFITPAEYFDMYACVFSNT